MAIEFFGKVDRKEGGKIKSQYPAWFFDKQMEELKESIDSKKKYLKSKVVPLDALPNYEAELERDEQLLKDIVDSKPKLTDNEKDNLKSFRERISKGIADSMFTNTDMDKGFASPNEEADRMVNPIIDVREKDIEVLKDLGIEHTNGKISRNKAAKAYQIISKLLGEDTNVERLRKAGTTSKRYIAK